MKRMFSHPIKDKHIRIYQDIDTELGTIRIYQHPKDTTLRAYIRQVSNYEVNQSGGLMDGSNVEIVINKRDITQDMFVEFLENGKTYKISPPDNLEFNTLGEIKLVGVEVAPTEPIKIQYKEWKK